MKKLLAIVLMITLSFPQGLIGVVNADNKKYLNYEKTVYYEEYPNSKKIVIFGNGDLDLNYYNIINYHPFGKYYVNEAYTISFAPNSKISLIDKKIIMIGHYSRQRRLGLFEKLKAKLVLSDNVNTQKLTSLENAFYDLDLNKINIDKIDTSNVTNLSGAFYNAKNIPDLSTFDTSNVKNMEKIFLKADLSNANISNWNTSRLQDLSYAFAGDQNIPSLNNWNVSSLTNISRAFSYAQNISNININGWNVSSVTDISGAFSYVNNVPDISSWDVSNVVRADGTFSQSTNIPDISNWNMSKLQSASGMFSNVKSAIPNISNWDLSKLNNASSMFSKSDLKNVDVQNFSFDSLNIQKTENMFSGTKNLKKYFNLDGKIMNSAFSGSRDLEVYLSSGLETSKVDFSNIMKVFDLNPEFIPVGDAVSKSSLSNRALALKNGIDYVPFTTFSINANNMKIGEKQKVSANFPNPAPTINHIKSWKSSDTNVAEIKNGVIYAKSKGSTTITATSLQGEVTTSAAININFDTIDKMEITQSLTKTTFEEGQNLDLSPLKIAITKNGAIDYISYFDFDKKMIKTNLRHMKELDKSDTVLIITHTPSNTSQEIALKILDKTYRVLVKDENGNQISANRYNRNQKVNLNANIKDGEYLVNWSVSKNAIKLDRPYDENISFSMPNKDIEIIVNKGKYINDTTFDLNIDAQNTIKTSWKKDTKTLTIEGKGKIDISKWFKMKSNISKSFSHMESDNSTVNLWGKGITIKILGNDIKLPDTVNSYTSSSILGMFEGYLGQLNISNSFDVSNVSDMRRLFKSAYNINIDISNWDFSNAHYLDSAFENAYSLNSDITLANTRNLQSLSKFLKNAKSIRNIDLINAKSIRNIDLINANFNESFSTKFTESFDGLDSLKKLLIKPNNAVSIINPNLDLKVFSLGNKMKIDSSKDYQKGNTISLSNGVSYLIIPKTEEYTRVTNLEFTDINLLVNEKQNLDYTIKPENASIKGIKEIKIFDESIAKFDGLKIRALRPGKTQVKITSLDGEISQNANMSVGYVSPKSLEIISNISSKKFVEGDKLDLNEIKVKLKNGAVEYLVDYLNFKDYDLKLNVEQDQILKHTDKKIIVTHTKTGQNASLDFKVERKKRALTVNNGTGSGEYYANDKVNISANTVDGKVFAYWIVQSGSGKFENPKSETTVFTTGYENSIIEAVYETPINNKDFDLGQKDKTVSATWTKNSKELEIKGIGEISAYKWNLMITEFKNSYALGNSSINWGKDFKISFSNSKIKLPTNFYNTYTYGIFQGFQGDLTLPNGFDIENLTDIRNIFNYAKNVNVDVSKWNTASLIYADYAFSNTSKLNPDVSNWDTSNLSSAYQMFQKTEALSKLDILKWNEKAYLISAYENGGALLKKLLMRAPNSSHYNSIKFNGDHFDVYTLSNSGQIIEKDEIAKGNFFNFSANSRNDYIYLALPKGETYVRLASVEINNKDLYLGDKQELELVFKPENASIKNIKSIKSLTPEIIKVNDGVLHAIKPGSSQIEIFTLDGNIKTAKNINVKDLEIQSIKIDKSFADKKYTEGDAIYLENLSASLIHKHGIVNVKYADFDFYGLTVNLKDTQILTLKDNVLKVSHTKTKFSDEINLSIDKKRHKLEIVKGTGNGSYSEGDVVEIIANKIKRYIFEKWLIVKGNGSFESSTSSKTKFTMGDTETKIEAKYKRFIDPNDDLKDTFEYFENKNGLTITNYLASEKDVVIPDKIKGKKVTAIASNAFSIRGINSVVLPSHLEYIGDSAFFNNNLESISIPSSVFYIGFSAFKYNKLKTVSLKEGLLYLYDDSFSYNPIQKISLPKSLLYAGNQFLKQSDYKLSGNFSYIVQNGNAVIISYFGTNRNLVIPSTIDGYKVIGVSVGRDAVLASSIKKYVAFSWDGNREYDSVTISEGVERVEARAFAGVKIKTLNLPNSLKSIGYEAFVKSGIQNLRLGNGVKFIGNNAFTYNSLSDFRLPASLKHLGSSVFQKNPNLYRITFLGDFKLWFADKINSYFNIEYKTTLNTKIGHVGPLFVASKTKFEGKEVKAGTELYTRDVFETKIEPYTTKKVNAGNQARLSSGVSILKYNASEKNIKIPEYINGEKVVAIAKEAFKNKGIDSVILPSGLEYIGDKAFEGNNLTSITVPSNVWCVDYYAFRNNKLTKVVLNEGLLSVSGGAFSNNPIRDIAVPNSVIDYSHDYSKFHESEVKKSGDFAYLVINGEATIISYLGNSSDIVVPSTIDGYRVIAVGNGIELKVSNKPARYLDFFKKGSYNSLRLSEGIERIETSAFLASDLKTVKLPNSLKSIGMLAFSASKVENIEFGNNLKYIGTSAFIGTKLKEVELPASVEQMGLAVFTKTPSLTKIKFLGTFKPWFFKRTLDYGKDNVQEKIPMKVIVTGINDKLYTIDNPNSEFLGSGVSAGTVLYVNKPYTSSVTPPSGGGGAVPPAGGGGGGPVPPAAGGGAAKAKPNPKPKKEVKPEEKLFKKALDMLREDLVKSLIGGIKTEKTRFEDIKTHWAKKSVEFANSNNLFKGVSETRFAPDAKVTRAMIVTVLSRTVIQKSVSKAAVFTDVKSNTWYSKAVSWASSNSIVNGISKDKFAPETLVTREQLAVMFYRYVKYLGIKLKVAKENTFKDKSKIESWALESVNAMQASGIITGRNGGNFDPKASATRAEIAVLMQRILKLTVNK